MKLKLAEIVFRSWYYFRLGYSTYMSFLVAFFTFVSTTYYLAVTKVPLLQEIFTRFYSFVIVAILVIVPAGVLFGWLHMKRTLAFPTEATIGVEANPYNYILYPGKETDLYAPAWLLVIRSLRKIAEKENLLSPQEKSEFKNLTATIEKLLKGEVIGMPRQRKLLARLEEERSQLNK